MYQNQQNSQNQSNNNQDLDNLLREFQSLAETSEEPVITNENSMQQVNNSVLDGTYSAGIASEQSSVQQASDVQPLPGTQQIISTTNTNSDSFQSNNSIPATQTQVNYAARQMQTMPSSTVVQSEISTNTTPIDNSEMVQTPATNVTGQIQSAQEINQVDQQQIPVHPGMDVSLEGDGGDKTPIDLSNSNPSSSDNNNSVDEKSNIIFMVIIFAILGLFIMFMPKIDSFFNRKPGMEAKPTPTATPTPEENKEKIITCTMKKEIGTNLENQKSYRYYYKNNKVTKLEEINVKKYLLVNETNQSTYNTEQATCNTLATTYANILGFSSSCEETDNSFIIKKSYDLSTFINPTTITINGKAETIAVSVNFGDDINTIKSKVTASGATCK